MADVQAPGVWATFHHVSPLLDNAPPVRVKVLEVVNTDQDDPNPDYVWVESESGLQYAMYLADGWFSDPDGILPAALPTAPLEG